MFVEVVSRFESPMARSADSGPLASAFRLVVCSSTCSCICFVPLSSHLFCSPLSAFPPALSSLSAHLPCSLTVPPCLSLYLSLPPSPTISHFFSDWRLTPRNVRKMRKTKTVGSFLLLRQLHQYNSTAVCTRSIGLGLGWVELN